jgi:hypothetical protein
MEIVHPRGGDAVTLRPCPPWCTQDRHFDDGETVDVDDGFHHYGTETEIETSDRYAGHVTGPAATVRVVLKSWTHPLDAEPGPARIEISIGTAKERTDSSVEVTPGEAQLIAYALLGRAETAAWENQSRKLG